MYKSRQDWERKSRAVSLEGVVYFLVRTGVVYSFGEAREVVLVTMYTAVILTVSWQLRAGAKTLQFVLK